MNAGRVEWSTCRGSLGRVTERLAAAGCIAADEEADELVIHARDARTLESWVRRRENGEPLAWIVGTLEFCGRRLSVDPGVYVPRLQSEELARRAAERLNTKGDRAADLCTGSGAIAKHLMENSPGSMVVGVDIDFKAAKCARRNGVNAVLGDLGEPLGAHAFDVVTAVAPYVPTGQLDLLPPDVVGYEPLRALDGGADGLELLRRIVVAASSLLRRGGWLLVELGGEQDNELLSTIGAVGFDVVESWYDEDGDLRGMAAHMEE